jgi:hypothetical protein
MTFNFGSSSAIKTTTTDESESECQKPDSNWWPTPSTSCIMLKLNPHLGPQPITLLIDMIFDGNDDQFYKLRDCCCSSSCHHADEGFSADVQ